MRRSITLLLVAGVVSATALAGESANDAFSIWLEGKSRDEVVRVLGEPSRVKRRGGLATLVYKYGRKGSASFPSTSPNPYAFVREHDDGSGATDTAVDVLSELIFPENPRAYGDFDHAEQLEGVGPIRRIELRLDAGARVSSARVVRRKKRRGGERSPRARED